MHTIKVIVIKYAVYEIRQPKKLFEYQRLLAVAVAL